MSGYRVVTLKAHRLGILASVAAAMLWAVLAWRTPTSTHHFAPLVVAGVWGYIARHSESHQTTPADRVLMGVGGAALALGTQLVLTVADKLDGPALIEAVPVPTELALMSLLGAVIGSGLLHRRRRTPASPAETG